MDKQIDYLLKSGIAKRSTTAYGCQGFMVPKKGPGDYRMVTNFTSLNLGLIPETFPSPDAETILSSAAGNKYFVNIDCTSGFFQILMHEDSIKYLGFSFYREMMAFNVLPQGLSCSPGIFQSYMQLMLEDMIKEKQALVYADDITLVANTEDQLIERNRKLMTRLKEYNIFKKILLSVNLCVIK